MPNATEILNKVLNHAKKYVIIHRQDIEEKTNIVNYQTYGGMNTVNFIFLEKILIELQTKTIVKLYLKLNRSQSIQTEGL